MLNKITKSELTKNTYILLDRTNIKHELMFTKSISVHDYSVVISEKEEYFQE